MEIDLFQSCGHHRVFPICWHIECSTFTAYCFCALLGHLCMKCSLGISKFFEEIFSLYYSIVSFYFFALINEAGFLLSPYYSLELCIEMDIAFLFLLCLSLLFFSSPSHPFFSQLFLRPPQTIILSFCIFSLGKGLDHCIFYNVTNLHP